LKTRIHNVRKIIGVGPNFRAFRAQKNLPEQDAPFLFLKSPESLVTEEHVYLSPMLEEFICEVEMAVIIGRTARNVSPEDALHVVAGYALANDITATAHMDDGRFKMFDQTTPIGPFVPGAGIDPSEVTLEMKVNGRLIQRDHTGELTYSVPWLISHISRLTTLREGDILLTGTPANPMQCAFGDTIELSSPELGYYKHVILKGA